jgi:hypothetical protein
MLPFTLLLWRRSMSRFKRDLIYTTIRALVVSSNHSRILADAR